MCVTKFDSEPHVLSCNYTVKHSLQRLNQGMKSVRIIFEVQISEPAHVRKKVMLCEFSLETTEFYILQLTKRTNL